MPFALSYAGSDLGGVSIGLRVMKFDHNLMHGASMSNIVVPGVDGVVPVGNEIQPNTISSRVQYRAPVKPTSRTG